MVPQPLFSRVGCNIDQQGPARDGRNGSTEVHDTPKAAACVAGDRGKAEVQGASIGRLFSSATLLSHS
jgi:hypothetical protein